MEKLNLIKARLTEDIMQECSCDFDIDSESFSCGGSQGSLTNTVVFRARVTVQNLATIINAGYVVNSINDWVMISPRIAVQGATLDVDNTCPVMLASFNEADCITTTSQLTPSLSIAPSPSTSSSDSTTSDFSTTTIIIAGAGMAGLIVLLLVIIIGILCVVLYYRRKGSYRLIML